MLVLFDNNVPRALARYLTRHHIVAEARDRGWGEFENGALLAEAESAGFEVFVTADKNIRYQHNLKERRIGYCRTRQGPLGANQTVSAGSSRRS